MILSFDQLISIYEHIEPGRKKTEIEMMAKRTADSFNRQYHSHSITAKGSDIDCCEITEQTCMCDYYLLRTNMS